MVNRTDGIRLVKVLRPVRRQRVTAKPDRDHLQKIAPHRPRLDKIKSLSLATNRRTASQKEPIRTNPSRLGRARWRDAGGRPYRIKNDIVLELSCLSLSGERDYLWLGRNPFDIFCRGSFFLFWSHGDAFRNQPGQDNHPMVDDVFKRQSTAARCGSINPLRSYHYYYCKQVQGPI